MIQASVLLAVAGRVHGTAQPRVHILPISWWRTFRVRHTRPKVRDSWLWTHNVIQRQELQCGYPFVSMHCLQALPLSSCTVHPLRIPACRTPGKGEAVMWRISCRPSGSATKPFRIFCAETRFAMEKIGQLRKLRILLSHPLPQQWEVSSDAKSSWWKSYEIYNHDLSRILTPTYNIFVLLFTAPA
jgi:hypothetical protein